MQRKFNGLTFTRNEYGQWKARLQDGDQFIGILLKPMGGGYFKLTAQDHEKHNYYEFRRSGEACMRVLAKKSKLYRTLMIKLLGVVHFPDGSGEQLSNAEDWIAENMPELRKIGY